MLDIRIGGAPRFYVHNVPGFEMQGPRPSREQCLEDRASVADLLMTMTEHCSDADGRGTLTRSLR